MTFADDTPIFIRRDPIYLTMCILFLEYFARISGLQCNLEKTSVIPIGDNFNINDRLCSKLALSLENSFILLGFPIDSGLKQLNDNYDNT